MFVAFHIVLWLAAASFFIPAGLITASLFMADRAPQSPTFIGVSVAMSLSFFAAGLLILGIQSKVVALFRLSDGGEVEARNGANRPLSFLAAYLMIGCIAVCLIMATVTFAIVARINEGYPVFG